MIDTQRAVENLVQAGIDESQAKAIVGLHRDSAGQLATKDDLARLAEMTTAKLELVESRLTVRMGGFAIAVASLAVAVIKLT